MSRGTDDDIGTMVMVIVGMMMASTLISQIPVDEDMNVWDKVKTITSSAVESVQDSFNGEDSGDAPGLFDQQQNKEQPAPPAEQPERQPAPPADKPAEQPAEDGGDGGESFAERLGFDFSGGN